VFLLLTRRIWLGGFGTGYFFSLSWGEWLGGMRMVMMGAGSKNNTRTY